MDNLPEEIFLNILLYLNVKDIINSSYVNKKWLRISKDFYIWKKLTLQKYNINGTLRSTEWRKFYYSYKNWFVGKNIKENYSNISGYLQNSLKFNYVI